MREEEFLTCAKEQDGNLANDILEFADYKSIFTNQWQDAYHTKVLGLDDIVMNKLMIAELKQMNSDIGIMAERERDSLNKIEGWANDGVGMTVAAKDFGFSGARKGINNGNWDKLVLSNNQIKAAIVANFGILGPLGLTTVKRDAFFSEIAAIDALNTAKNLKEEKKKQVVAANLVFFNDVYADMMFIADTGKRLYKISNPKKAEAYTISKILRRITHKVKKENTVIIDSHITGLIYSLETGEELEGAKVWTNNNLTGMLTKADGIFSVGGEAANTTKLYVSCTGYKDKVIDIEIDKGVTMELDVDMEVVESE